ncbi:MAG: thioredoxin family protein [Thermodesulfobacteriota bacterium]
MNSIIIPCPHCSTKNRVPAMRQHHHPRCSRCKKQLEVGPAAVVVDLDDQDLDMVLRDADLPLVVDCYSPTCGPCRMLAPVLERLARVFLGRLIIAKLDTSHNPHAAARFNIRGVPTLLCFKNGRVVNQLVGALPEASLIDRFNTFLADN